MLHAVVTGTTDSEHINTFNPLSPLFINFVICCYHEHDQDTDLQVAYPAAGTTKHV